MIQLHLSQLESLLGTPLQGAFPLTASGSREHVSLLMLMGTDLFARCIDKKSRFCYHFMSRLGHISMAFDAVAVAYPGFIYAPSMRSRMKIHDKVKLQDNRMNMAKSSASGRAGVYPRKPSYPCTLARGRGAGWVWWKFYQVKASSMKSMLVRSCRSRTARRTSSLRDPGPHTETAMAPT